MAFGAHGPQPIDLKLQSGRLLGEQQASNYNALFGVQCPLVNGGEEAGCCKMIIGKKVGGPTLLFGPLCFQNEGCPAQFEHSDFQNVKFLEMLSFVIFLMALHDHITFSSKKRD